ncbi:hypothetical protein BDW02DRAFT_566548 [Decorospora gaudefroyi]|uniref:C2H2-type domain-containing protein n=1 Tax=Decorospora gaudefroyi TaxID=184978 RepID=A0A6A5KM54_9PLEO|nr:hypothetical protein BDW02DRAFT_566548 [Decorospora gaudefroyi]
MNHEPRVSCDDSIQITKAEQTSTLHGEDHGQYGAWQDELGPFDHSEQDALLVSLSQTSPCSYYDTFNTAGWIPKYDESSMAESITRHVGYGFESDIGNHNWADLDSPLEISTRYPMRLSASDPSLLQSALPLQPSANSTNPSIAVFSHTGNPLTEWSVNAPWSAFDHAGRRQRLEALNAVATPMSDYGIRPDDHTRLLLYNETSSTLENGYPYNDMSPESKDHLETPVVSLDSNLDRESPSTSNHVSTLSVRRRQQIASSDTDIPNQSTRESIGDDIVVCKRCSAEFTGPYRRGNLGRHTRAKHVAIHIPCFATDCSATFRRIDARIKHCRKYHPELGLPPAVIRPSHEQTSYHCTEPNCGRTFDLPGELSRHQRTHLTGPERPHRCHTCPMSFLFRKDLLRHSRTHQDGPDSPFRCPVSSCSHTAGFSRKDNLRRHIRRWHPDSSLE